MQKRGCLKSQLFKQPRKFGGRESAEFAREFRFLPLFSSISGENRAKTSRPRDEKLLDGLFKAIPHNSRVQIAEMIFCLFSLRNRRKTGGFSRFRRGNRRKISRLDVRVELCGIALTLLIEMPDSGLIPKPGNLFVCFIGEGKSVR